MKKLDGLDYITQLFVDHFLRVAELTKQSPVPFGTLFIGFMLASKVLAETFVKLNLISREESEKLSSELDEVVKTASFKRQVSEIVDKIKEEEDGCKPK